jgi:hypothetical protein
MLKDLLRGIDRLVVRFGYLDALVIPSQLGAPRPARSCNAKGTHIVCLAGPKRLYLPTALAELAEEGLQMTHAFSEYENDGATNKYHTRFLFLRYPSEIKVDQDAMRSGFSKLTVGYSWDTKICESKADGAVRLYLKTPREFRPRISNKKTLAA